MGFNIGAFMGGLGQGASQTMDLYSRYETMQRDKELHGLRKEALELGIKSAKRQDELEEALHGQNVEYRGLALDYKIGETRFAKDLLPRMNALREQWTGLQEQEGRIRSGQLQGQEQRQPDELRMEREKLNLNMSKLWEEVSDASDRQAARMWQAFRSGNKKLGLSMFNNSMMVSPGERYTDAKIEQIETKDAEGNTIKVPTFVAYPAEGKGEPRRIPVAELEKRLANFGVKYEKVGNNLVRIDRQGNVEPVYEPDQFMTVPEGGSVASRRTGRPPAAGGIVPGPSPGSNRKQESHVDDRVRQGTAVVNRYFGISDLSGLDPKNQSAYTTLVEDMGKRVRGGADPEAAATAAIRKYERDQELAKTGKPGGGAYTGPTPWR